MIKIFEYLISMTVTHLFIDNVFLKYIIHPINNITGLLIK